MSIKEINKKISVLGTSLYASIAYGIKFNRKDYEFLRLKKDKDWEIEKKINTALFKKIK